MHTGIDIQNAKLEQYWTNGIFYTQVTREDSSVTINWYTNNEVYDVSCLKESPEIVRDIVRTFKR